MKIKSLQVWERLENPGILGEFFFLLSEIHEGEKKMGKKNTFWELWKIPGKMKGGGKKRRKIPILGIKTPMEFQEINGYLEVR